VEGVATIPAAEVVADRGRAVGITEDGAADAEEWAEAEAADTTIVGEEEGEGGVSNVGNRAISRENARRIHSKAVAITIPIIPETMDIEEADREEDVVGDITMAEAVEDDSTATPHSKASPKQSDSMTMHRMPS